MLKKITNKIVNYKDIRRCGGKEVIMEFALGAIAIVLALVFREQLQGVIETVGGSFSAKIAALFNNI